MKERVEVRFSVSKFSNKELEIIDSLFDENENKTYKEIFFRMIYRIQELENELKHTISKKEFLEIVKNLKINNIQSEINEEDCVIKTDSNIIENINIFD